MTRLIPTEDELHAYIDERLAPARRAEVKAWLAANPQEAARVEGWRSDARRLRVALAGLGEQPGAAQLDLGQLKQRLRQRRQRRWASAAVLVLAIGVGGLGGWQARDAMLASVDLPMADAVQAHRLFAGSEALDIQASDPTQLRDWLGRHFSRVGQLPDLAGYGFRPVARGCLATSKGLRRSWCFRMARGNASACFFVCRESVMNACPRGSGLMGNWSTVLVAWAYNFALVSAADDTRGAGVGEALRLGL